MPRKGGRRRKTRTHVAEHPGTETDKTPKSFVFKMGKVPTLVQSLVQDMRRVMAPYTADKLREKRKNSLQDFVHVAAPLGVTHFMFFSSTETSTNLKIARVPRGPTLSFKVVGFALMRHLHLVQRRPMDASLAFKSKPLVVLNNFTSGEDHVQLLNVTFQNMFPAIDVQTVQLAECRRVVLFNYDKDQELIEFRQYVIRAKPLGLSRSVKTIIKAKVPDLSKLDDISDFVLGNSSLAMVDGGNVTSDSEVDDEDAHVTLPSSFRGRGNQKAQKSAVRLSEIGPRLTLKLTKVERELCEGDVLYHAFVSKTPEESAKAKAKREQALALKRKRREEQEANVSRKKQTLEDKKNKKLERKRATGHFQSTPNDFSDDDDAEYFRQEVGEEPDAYLFPKADDKKQHAHAKPKASADGAGAPGAGGAGGAGAAGAQKSTTDGAKKTKLTVPKQARGRVIRMPNKKKIKTTKA